ncbi:Major facilitator superfamily protein [Striga hermonthica]|uniref:Major facilitator superfamily protein n=1 Tax=Striga hermonthica TaxID=68872 RepID=A0A9N7MIA9_STRHE|nr:Major facilitator superfamily protein [Striga hermonthica]
MNTVQYYLKFQFHFNKDQFANLMIIAGIAGTISQLILMPLLTPLMGEETMLSVGLLFGCAHMLLHSIAWAPWVPYVASMVTVVSTFALPCLRSIASKQTGPGEQGKAQGCITGICSVSNIVSPLAFSPLTGNYKSSFSQLQMIAFVQSLTIRPAPSRVDNCSNVSTSGQIEPLV